MKIKKGISSVVIGLRFPQEVALHFEKKAKGLGFPNVEAYLKSQVMKSYIVNNTSSTQTEGVTNKVDPTTFGYATKDTPKPKWMV